MYIYGQNPKDEAPSFSTNPLKIGKNCQKSQISYLEKGVLEFCWAAMIKPRQIERFYWTTMDKLELTGHQVSRQ